MKHTKLKLNIFTAFSVGLMTRLFFYICLNYDNSCQNCTHWCISGLFNPSILSLGPIPGLHYEDCRFFFPLYGYTFVSNSNQVYEAQALKL